MLIIALCLLIGLAGGFASGLVGLGGGIVIVPALVFFLKYSQHLAQGTTLALLLPPLGLLAVIAYYKQGYVDLRVAVLLGIGFILGAWLGSRVALGLSDAVLTKVFGIVLLAVAIKMIFFK